MMNIDKLKNIIQSSHINFLFGSGLSCPYLTTLANIETWLTEANQITDENVRQLIQDNLSVETLPILPAGACVLSGVIADLPVIVQVEKLNDELAPKSQTITLADAWIDKDNS